MLTHIFSRRYAHHHAMLIVFLASALWGVLWIPMRHIESFGLSGLWVVTMFHLLPAIAMSPFVISAFIADRQHWFIIGLAGGLMGIGFVLYGLGLVVASVTKTTVLFYLTPIWATLFAYILLSERFGFGRWLAIIGGITLLIGMLGAAIGQAPMAILVALYGRQEVMLWVALFALPFGAITLLIACVSNSSTHLYKKPSNLNTLVLKLLKSRQYWVSSTFTMTIAAPAISFPAENQRREFRSSCHMAPYR